MFKRRIPLYIHIAYLFVGLLLVFALVSTGFHYWQTQRLLADQAQQRYTDIASYTQAELRVLYKPSLASINLLSHSPLMAAESLEQRLTYLPILQTALQTQGELASVYVGYHNGDFILLRRWQDLPLFKRKFSQAPAGTVWVVQSQMHSSPVPGQFLYFDQQLRELAREPRPDYQFDPRTRRWFQQAQNRGQLYRSNPYAFFTTGEVGFTLAMPMNNGKAVVAADTTLQQLQHVLASKTITSNSQLALLSAAGEVLAWHAPNQTVDSLLGELPPMDKLTLEPLQRAYALPGEGLQVKQVSLAGEGWHVARIPIPSDAGSGLTLLLASPENELMAQAVAQRNQALLISGLMLLLGVALALALAQLAARPLRALAVEAAKIERFDFASVLKVDSNIAEVHDLANAMSKMKATIHRFLQLSLALSSETHFERLLAQVLKDMQEVCNAEGALIYLYDDQQAALTLRQVRWHGAELGLASEQVVPLADATHSLIQTFNQNSPALLDARVLNQDFAALPAQSHGLTLWSLPLYNPKHELIGVLALLIDQSRNPLNDALMAFARSLSNVAAVALNGQRLLNEQKHLLEAFIQLLAGAIDAKSPYTGGHCQRVPELTKMLAKAACEQNQGPLQGFNLDDEGWEALHIAGWLHDCGKITTPEYVVDKATKLETLYDRIHEVRMRFEVLKRDAQISYWQQRAADVAEPTALAQLDATLQQLDDDFAFVARCNNGDVPMSDEDLTRLQALAERRWQRTLSDRLGVGHEELARMQQTPEPALPCAEPLLADKPEHAIERPASRDFGQGFSMQTPTLLYQRGELSNLSVPRGTLTHEERYKINEHIIQTILMLEKLPFPRHLREVPEIAGGHHEKMNGQGYPRGLRREDMSWQARMMAVADIFEALTAIDRPYKEGKKLSQALKIMSFMQRDEHIDGDVFALFLRSGVYLQYAQRYMPPELIDEVCIEDYLPST
ncbi:HD domain-containing phosphohydrolase [Atopomonas sediminilitoris]|uniref:HD domain-containing phosphohydrolase n=1 Tax=Atopomonas sediminilitoris TaxID=2919919 RepID=UPI001F4D44A6|nr:HD domain-containing phosphohydrolase [Atopomonas sediminilitoris]MCJ8168784.1 GAF domain-containing protein [Atopomonas sediminilitoris]